MAIPSSFPSLSSPATSRAASYRVVLVRHSGRDSGGDRGQGLDGCWVELRLYGPGRDGFREHEVLERLETKRAEFRAELAADVCRSRRPSSREDALAIVAHIKAWWPDTAIPLPREG